MPEQITLPDYRAVRHVLTAPQIVGRTAPYIGDDDFDFAGLERESATMVARKLDADNFERVLDALRLARGAQAWSALAA